MQIVSLKCSSCGGDFKIGPDVERFACGYCGSSQVVHRNGGIITLSEVGAAIAEVKRGTDRTAAELAIRRLKEDLEENKIKIGRLIKANIAEKEQVQSFLTKAAAVVGVIPFFVALYYSGGFAIFWAIVVLVATIYLIALSRTRIDGRYQAKLNPLFEMEALKKRRLADQMRIVDE